MLSLIVGAFETKPLAELRFRFEGPKIKPYHDALPEGTKNYHKNQQAPPTQYLSEVESARLNIHAHTCRVDINK